MSPPTHTPSPVVSAEEMQQYATPPHPARAKTIDLSPESENSVPVVYKHQQTFDSGSQVSVQPGIDEILREGEARTAINPYEHNGVPEFQPFQNLLQTPIKLKYGKRFGGEYTIHLELAQCYSTVIQELFVQAEELNRAYVRGASIRKTLKALLPPETPHSAFQVEKAMDLIIKCHRKYPLLEHQIGVRKELEHATDCVFQSKDHWKGPTPNATVLKKKVSDFPSSEIRERLQCLNTDAVSYVTQVLHHKLCEIKKVEVQSARTNKLKAAAQHIIYLPQVEADATGAFVAWMYQQDNIQFGPPKTLCDLYTLADDLGVQNLAATCLRKLVTATYGAFNQARANGTSISALLEVSLSDAAAENSTIDPLADTVSTVFGHLQKARSPPHVLEALFADAIAASRDPELLKYLKTYPELLMKVSQSLMGQLCRFDTRESASKTGAQINVAFDT